MNSRRTMSEPDIDPKLADGLRSNLDFATWWVRQVLPSIELGELSEIKPNLTREKDSWSAQSRAGRETDLHVVVKDGCGDRYANPDGEQSSGASRPPPARRLYSLRPLGRVEWQVDQSSYSADGPGGLPGATAKRGPIRSHAQLRTDS